MCTDHHEIRVDRDRRLKHRERRVALAKVTHDDDATQRLRGPRPFVWYARAFQQWGYRLRDGSYVARVRVECVHEVKLGAGGRARKSSGRFDHACGFR